jgi:hypothetical protein
MNFICSILISIFAVQNLKRMFFVGATGQLLTLILTVCLPFVFLFSSEQKIDLLKETMPFEHIQIQQEIVSFETNSFQIYFDSIENLQNINIGFEDTFIQKTTITKVRIKWNSFCAESSGNKAPPVTNCFAC